VVKDNFAYAPKQEYDAASRETIVYMPYGPDPKGELYWEPYAGVFTDPAATDYALFSTKDAKKISHLTYAMAFNKEIGSFRIGIGYAELVMGDTCTAGVEYSTDGKTWKNIVQHAPGAKTVMSPFVSKDTVIDGIKTKMLLIRIYTRDTKSPNAATGDQMYIKFRATGNPDWGDATRTFFSASTTVWVTEYSKK
jgi:hypothetical protein